MAEGDLCRVCRDPGRDATVICVVEESKDQAAIEKAGVVKGRYHILGGAISPLEGIAHVSGAGCAPARPASASADHCRTLRRFMRPA